MANRSKLAHRASNWLAKMVAPLLLSLTLSVVAHSAESQPLSKVATISSHPGTKGHSPSDIEQIDGSVVFSAYDDNGNTRSIYELDPSSGRIDVLVKSRNNLRLLAKNDRYLIVNTAGHPPSFPIEVTDRASGLPVKKLRLRDQVVAAEIVDGQLLLVQSSHEGGRALKTVYMDIPSLKVKKEIPLPEGNLLWFSDQGAFILDLGKRNVRWYDHENKELGHFVLPPRDLAVKSPCESFTALKAESYAVIQANCGALYIYDLKTSALKHAIPGYKRTGAGYEKYYSISAYKNLVFRTSWEAKSGTAIVDTDTGKEIGRLPINARHIFIKNERLLATASNFYDSAWPIDIYKIDFDVLKNDEWRRMAIIAGCKDERGKQHTRDLYEAIHSCTVSGIDAVLKDDKIPKELIPSAINYATWLSRSLHRFSEAIPIIDKLKGMSVEVPPMPAIEAMAKQSYFSGSLNADEVVARFDSPFTRLLRTKLTSVQIDERSGNNKLKFIDENVYIPVSDCKVGIGVDVYDRNTFVRKSRVILRECGDVYEEPLKVVAADKDQVYLKADAACPDESEEVQSFFIIDKRTWKLQKGASLSRADKSLAPTRSTIELCDCDAIGEYHSCIDVDTQTSRCHESTKRECRRGKAVPITERLPYYVPEIETPKFYVAEYGHVFSFMAKEAPKVSLYEYDTNDSLYSNMLEVPGRDALIHIGDTDEFGRPSIRYIDPVAKQAIILATLNEVTGAYLSDACMHVSDGHDVYSFSLSDFSAKSILPINYGANRLSAIKISAITVDRDHLIVRFSEGSGRVFNLRDIGCAAPIN